MQQQVEDLRVKQIDFKLSEIRNHLNTITPTFKAIVKTKAYLEAQLKALEDEKLTITQGQMVFDGTVEF